MDNATINNEAMETNMDAAVDCGGSGFVFLIGTAVGLLAGVAICKVPTWFKSQKKKTDKAAEIKVVEKEFVEIAEKEDEAEMES